MKLTINWVSCMIILVIALIFSNDISAQNKDSATVNLQEKYKPLTRNEKRKYKKSLEYIEYLDKKTGKESKKIQLDNDKKKFEETYHKELGKAEKEK